MTYEQYGNGPWLVTVTGSGFFGSYRFQTQQDAKSWQAQNGGQISYNPGEFAAINALAAIRDGA